MKVLMICILFCVSNDASPTDSFCTLYEKVIREKGDAAIKAPLTVKKRLLINEQNYRKLCGGSK